MKPGESDRGEAKRLAAAGARVLGLVGLVCSLSGCLLSRPPEQAETLGQALPRTRIPSRWVTPTSGKPVTNNWVKSFHDPGLDAVVKLAIENNLDLRQAASRVQVAQQMVTVVGSQLLPHIGANLSAARTYTDRDRNRTETSQEALGILSWELDLWGKLRAQRAAAEASSQAATLEYAYARQSLAATAAKAWLVTIEAHKMMGLAEKSVSIYSELLRLVQTREVAGRVSDFDVVQAKANVSEAKSALLQAQAALAEAIRGLEQLIGQYPSGRLRVTGSYPRAPGAVRAGLPSTLLLRRPDVAAAEQRVLTEFRQREAARLALLPSFSLNVAGGRLEDNILSILHLNPWMVHSVIGMTVPIYTGGALLAEAKIENAKEQEAVAHYGSVALTSFKEVENGLTNDRILRQRVGLQFDAVKDRTEAVRLGNLKLQAGSIDLLPVLQLTSYQIAAEATLIQLQNSQLSNRVSLYLALGGGFDEKDASDVTVPRATF